MHKADKQDGNQGQEQTFISIYDLSQRVGISRSTIVRRIADGSITQVKIGRRILIPANVIDKMIQDQGR